MDKRMRKATKTYEEAKDYVKNFCNKKDVEVKVEKPKTETRVEKFCSYTYKKVCKGNFELLAQKTNGDIVERHFTTIPRMESWISRNII